MKYWSESPQTFPKVHSYCYYPWLHTKLHDETLLLKTVYTLTLGNFPFLKVLFCSLAFQKLLCNHYE